MPFKSGASIKSVAPVLHSGKMFHISLCQREHQLLYIKICQGPGIFRDPATPLHSKVGWFDQMVKLSERLIMIVNNIERIHH